jgi:hypothetical protein
MDLTEAPAEIDLSVIVMDEMHLARQRVYIRSDDSPTDLSSAWCNAAKSPAADWQGHFLEFPKKLNSDWNSLGILAASLCLSIPAPNPRRWIPILASSPERISF